MNDGTEPLEIVDTPEDDEIYQLFREARARRHSEKLARSRGRSNRFRLTLGLVLTALSFTLFTAFTLLPHI